MSTVNYSFNWPSGPKDVVVTGEFDEWKGSFHLKKSPTTGEFEVTLPVGIPAEKDRVFFKFIVDGQWVTSGFYKIGTDQAGIENNYISKQDLHQAVGVADSSTTPKATETRTASAPQPGDTAEAVVARSSKNLDVKPSVPQTTSSSTHRHEPHSGHHHEHGHDHDHEDQHRQHHHHHHHHHHRGEPAATTTTPSKTKESHAANGAGVAATELPARSAGGDALAASAAASALRKVKIKRKIKKNKKTGERIVVSEERIPLNEDDEAVLGSTTFEEEEFSPAAKTSTSGSAQGTPRLANAAAGAAVGAAAGTASVPPSVTGTNTPTPTRQRPKHLQQGAPVVGSVNSPSNSPSIRKTRPVSATGVTRSPSAGPSRNGSTKERPVSAVGRPASPSRSRSGTPVGLSGSAAASAGATAATAAARKDRPTSTVITDSTPSSARKTVSRGGSIKKATNELGSAEAKGSSGATGPLGTRLPGNANEETFHILPIDTSDGDNTAFKSLAGEPGPFVPSNQEQLKAFSEVNDNVDPQAFNERLNRQFKTEHNISEKESNKKLDEKIDQQANAENLGRQHGLDDLDKKANKNKLEEISKGDAAGKLKNDENLHKLGEDALHGKVDKEDAFDTLKNDKSNLTDAGKSLASDAKGSGTGASVDTGADTTGTKNSLGNLGKDDTLKELGKDATQGNVNKGDALDKLGKDSILKDAGEGAAVGVLGGGVVSKSKSKTKKKNKKNREKKKNKNKAAKSSEEESREKSGTPDTIVSSEVTSGEEKGSEEDKGVKSAGSDRDDLKGPSGNGQKLDGNDSFANDGFSNIATTSDSTGQVDDKEVATSAPGALAGATGVAGISTANTDERKLGTEALEKTDLGKKASEPTKKTESDERANILSKEAGPLGKDTTSATGAPANISKQESLSTKKVPENSLKRSEPSELHEKQTTLPTLDPRARKGAADTGSEARPISSQQYNEFDTDGNEKDEVSLDPSKQNTSEPTGQQVPKTTVANAGAGAASSKDLAKKTGKTTPSPTKSKEANDTTPTKTKRHSLADSGSKLGKSPQSKSTRPKSVSDTVKKESKDSATKSVSGSAGSTELASGTPKGTSGTKSKKEIATDALKQGKCEAETSKGKSAKDAAADLAKTGKSSVEGGKGRNEVAKDVLKQGKSEAGSAKGKSAKEIVTDAAKTGKKEADASKGKGAKGVAGETANAGKSESGATAAAEQKPPPQSSLANAANRTEKKKKVGLWTRIKRILQ
ncbi:hypothetical protein ZYGR_0AV01980 [Zygosaccharomyces rouxii]|uniref:AMP-activated protein kinase glycogen-binding domain-containing protein n=1 Tax=Zygosaccharomyces rouxii TaxID=4956 RepID=A0A1Q3AIK7_ZYGRO|nr:hypothetical protein ZYGR_0AV01980 [Zygosaccharomyces rouxii]